MGRGIKKFDLRAMIEERRLEVARLYYRGNKTGKNIATVIIPKWNVDIRTVQMDLKYIRDHEPEILRDYMVRTVPHVLNMALSRLDQANSEAWAIIEKSDCSDKEKIAAVGVIGKIAKDMVDIITNNKSVIDLAGITVTTADAMPRTTANSSRTLMPQKEEVRKENNTSNNKNELSGEEAAEPPDRADPQAVF